MCQAFATERSSWEAAQTAVKRRHEVEEYALRVYFVCTACALRVHCCICTECRNALVHVRVHATSTCHMCMHVHVHQQAELEEGRGGWDEQRRALEKRLAREQKAAQERALQKQVEELRAALAAERGAQAEEAKELDRLLTRKTLLLAKVGELGLGMGQG